MHLGAGCIEHREFRARRVILRQAADGVEELRAVFVVEVLRGERLAGLGQPGEHVLQKGGAGGLEILVMV
jgi:hypothetical protein